MPETEELLVVNEVRVLRTNRGEARLRVQLSPGGRLGIRSAPEHGEPGELAALAAIANIRAEADLKKVAHRVFASRRNGGPPVVDALDFSSAEGARQVTLVSSLLLFAAN